MAEFKVWRATSKGSSAGQRGGSSQSPAAKPHTSPTKPALGDALAGTVRNSRLAEETLVRGLAPACDETPLLRPALQLSCGPLEIRTPGKTATGPKQTLWHPWSALTRARRQRPQRQVSERRGADELEHTQHELLPPPPVHSTKYTRQKVGSLSTHQPASPQNQVHLCKIV